MINSHLFVGYEVNVALKARGENEIGTCVGCDSVGIAIDAGGGIYFFPWHNVDEVCHAHDDETEDEENAES